MKRVLLGSTVIVGAALLLSGPAFADVELSISGYAKFEVWAGSQDDESDYGNRGTHMEIDDSEVHFKFRGESDNGLTYGGKLEVDMDSGTSTNDEIMLWFSGDWGRIEVGNDDGAEDAMPYDGTFSLISNGGYDGGIGAMFDFNGVTAGSPGMAGASGDNTKITYYTPRFSGIQAGISYTPDLGHDIGSGNLDSNDGDMENHIGIGVNFVDSINGVDVGIGGAMVFSGGEDTRTAEDAEGYHVGFNIGFSGFTVGAGYGDNGDSGELAGSTGDAGKWWEFAGGYTTGPLGIHVGYFHGERDMGTGLSDDETDIFTLGVQYAVAPGLTAYAEYDHIKVDQDGTGDGVDNEGDVIMIGTKIAF